MIQQSILVTGLVAAAASSSGQPAADIPWDDYLLPLPKEISVNGTARTKPENVAFTVAANASEMVVSAVADLRTRIGATARTAPTGADVVVTIGCLAEDGTVSGQEVAGAERLKSVPNATQAYLIRPAETDGLIVAAWHDRGLFYGVQTLTQLLTAKRTASEIVVPRASITDWPDFAERGPWNVDIKHPDIIPWMASYKLNFTHVPTRIVLREDKPATCPSTSLDLVREATQIYAFTMPVHCPHYDFWHRAEVNKLYPEIVGRGDTARHPFGVKNPEITHFARARCPCASQPKFQELVTDWVRSAASQGVHELSLWLSEFPPQQCACDTCMSGPRQWVRETIVSIAAIQTVRKEYPDLVGRIFFTLRTAQPEVADSAACLALFPVDGIKVEKAYGRNNAFDAHAAAGNWVANYGLTISAANLRDRIRDYHRIGYSAVYAIGAKNQRVSDQHLQALAEWGWNAHGRDEFALNQAYATRLGVPNPPQFAAWQDAVRPLNTMQRRLHNTPHGTSAVIMPMLWGDTLQAMAAKGPASPRMPDAATLANLLEQCDQAMQSATASGVAYLSEHTLFLKTYFRSVRQLSSLHEIVMQTAPKADRPALERETTKLLGLLTSSLGHLKQAAALRERDPEKGTARFRRFIEETKTELGACLR